MFSHRDKKLDSLIEKLPPLVEEGEYRFKILTEDFKVHYKEYMDGLKNQFPAVNFQTELYCYQNDYFGDADHLNEKGTERFSNEFIAQNQGIW